MARKKPAVVEAAPASPLPTQCPTCGGSMYDTSRGSRYCPAEDPHPGGLLILSNGQVYPWGIIGVPDKEGVA